MIKFDLKKFIGLIGVQNQLMQLYYDKAEAQGIDSCFDIYHILEGKETPSPKEIEIMEAMFKFNIIGTPYEKDYMTADTDFPVKIAERNKVRMSYNQDHRHLNN